MPQPHFVRFAQALALLTGLAGASGCSASTTLGTDSGGGGNDASMVADSSGEGSDGGGGVDAAIGDDAATADAAATMDDAATAEDASNVADAGEVAVDCSACDCFSPPDVDAGIPSCESVGHTFPCCVAIGPLAPPDLMV